MYEFFRIFSFMTGMSLAEYIRRRRLSQAVFALQNGDERIIDIALRCGYESPTSFTKAFKDLHGVTPSVARKNGVTLKTFPPLSFKFTIQGVTEMEFKIMKREAFTLYGIAVAMDVEKMDEFKLPSIFAIKPFAAESFNFTRIEDDFVGEQEIATPDGGKIKIIVTENRDATFIHYDQHGNETERTLEPGGNTIQLGEGETTLDYITTAFDYTTTNGKVNTILGGEQPTTFRAQEPHTIPAATFAVFTFNTEPTQQATAQAYTRILTEWLPTSGYQRDTAVPHLERMPFGGNAKAQSWEVWLPVQIKA